MVETAGARASAMTAPPPPHGTMMGDIDIDIDMIGPMAAVSKP